MRTALCLGLVVVVGCGAGGPPPLPPAPTVTVTLDGKPATGLNVRLYRADGTPAGGGSTGPDGKTELRGPDGVPPAVGSYKVVVIDLGDDEPDPMSDKPRPKQKSRVPASCGKPATTPLTLAIEAGKMDYTLAVKGN
jgi:hypothetical protein